MVSVASIGGVLFLCRCFNAVATVLAPLGKPTVELNKVAAKFVHCHLFCHQYSLMFYNPRCLLVVIVPSSVFFLILLLLKLQCVIANLSVTGDFAFGVKEIKATKVNIKEMVK